MGNTLYLYFIKDFLGNNIVCGKFIFDRNVMKTKSSFNFKFIKSVTS